MHNYSSQPLPDTPLARLSLAKFSHVTTSLSHRGPLNWGHIIGNNDLTATFEKPRATNSLSGNSIVLRIFRFHDTMEELDLSFFAMAATKTPSQPAQGQASKPSFAVVVKLPCLAVKYPRGNMIRRFQIKFSAEKDYYAALAILSEINCPFSEASPAPIHKQTSSQWNTGSFRPSSMSSEPTVPNTIIPPNNGVGFPVYAPGTYARLPMPSVTAGIAPHRSCQLDSLWLMRGSRHIDNVRIFVQPRHQPSVPSDKYTQQSRQVHVYRQQPYAVPQWPMPTLCPTGPRHLGG
ncbi:uncharacterized protein BO95DRAFT_371194 [Aspergillus brunneoviolaceus CBS 621.78]|uniref:Uncharacterized protein n=1 Tax=Aspergillus brunneoviolaceus CBS 621.78 TaxID=1450534 RepID=A0ACD1FZ60_9EURO|nr:hypothetical protein BO95DRAFT_371194 [Aspergillus brunneoviolaceus CBS 621.78]RAH42259.1 hypothetical protein BO95DRAFT_371194 [Aspergillus brunneoviolaceus CBS 621.78]